jgi:hypothetical protein
MVLGEHHPGFYRLNPLLSELCNSWPNDVGESLVGRMDAVSQQ